MNGGEVENAGERELVENAGERELAKKAPGLFKGEFEIDMMGAEWVPPVPRETTSFSRHDIEFNILKDLGNNVDCRQTDMLGRYIITETNLNLNLYQVCFELKQGANSIQKALSMTNYFTLYEILSHPEKYNCHARNEQDDSVRTIVNTFEKKQCAMTDLLKDVDIYYETVENLKSIVFPEVDVLECELLNKLPSVLEKEIQSMQGGIPHIAVKVEVGNAYIDTFTPTAKIVDIEKRWRLSLSEDLIRNLVEEMRGMATWVEQYNGTVLDCIQSGHDAAKDMYNLRSVYDKSINYVSNVCPNIDGQYYVQFEHVMSELQSSSVVLDKSHTVLIAGYSRCMYCKESAMALATFMHQTHCGVQDEPGLCKDLWDSAAALEEY